jgi:C-terminal peptidase prc
MTSLRLKAVFASAALGFSMSLVPQAGIAMSHAQNQELDYLLDAINDRFVIPEKAADRNNHEQVFLDAKSRNDDFTDKEFADSANRLMGSLDPHSHYYDAQETRVMQEQNEGYLVGIGARLALQDGYPKIEKVFPGSPAERGGMKKGDLILHIHDSANQVDVDTNDSDLIKVVKALTGLAGTQVDVQVKREGSEQPVPLTFRRGRVDVNPVTYEFDNDVGYIKLDQFNYKAASGVRDAIAAIEDAHGAQKGYIFDLRGNPGGFVDEAVAILSAFATHPIPNAIVMKGNGISQTHPVSNAQNLLKNKPLIVLIDENSVSASELTSGALKDMGRAKIYGNQSFGKGSAWTPVQMPSHNILGVTHSLYYLPSGKSIQLQGVVPDILYLRTASQMNRALEAHQKTLKTLREKFPNDPDKQRPVYNEASEKNALVLTDPAMLDRSKPSATCSLVSETPAPDTPAPLIMEPEKSSEPKKLDSIKTCAWESLIGRRLNTRILTYQGESLRFTPPAP